MSNAKQAERYTLREWVERETESYSHFLADMTGHELVEEYHRQGGTEGFYFDEATDELVLDHSGCAKCGGRTVSNTAYSPKGSRFSDSWCPKCGYFWHEYMSYKGSGTFYEGQLSPEEFARHKLERQQLHERDSEGWRALPGGGGRTDPQTISAPEGCEPTVDASPEPSHQDTGETGNNQQTAGGDGEDVGIAGMSDETLKSMLLDRLRAAGVTTFSIEFDGYADSGCVEIAALDGNGAKVQLPKSVEELAEAYLDARLSGWEIDDGSFGTVEFDVAARQGEVRPERAYVEITNEQWEE